MNVRDKGQPVLEREPVRAKGLFPINLALADYDRTRPIIDGRVKPEGIALKVNTAWIGEFCERPVYEEYDVAEFSLSWYVAARCRGEPVVALPLFPLRMPVLAYIFCRADAPYLSPRDLIGKRIGAPGYRYTVNLWLRGIMKEHYGLSPEHVTWITAAPEGAGYVIPKGVTVKVVPGGKPEEMLERGEADAIVVPSVPKPFASGEAWIRRLFRDCRAETRSYYTRTGIVPITHTIVMKQSLSEREPWIAKSMVKAFADAQRACDEFYRSDPKHLGFPESVFFLEEQRAVYGPEPWGQGLDGANRHVIETFVRYAHEQGYISRRMALEELFATDALAL